MWQFFYDLLLISFFMILFWTYLIMEQYDYGVVNAVILSVLM